MVKRSNKKKSNKVNTSSVGGHVMPIWKKYGIIPPRVQNVFQWTGWVNIDFTASSQTVAPSSLVGVLPTGLTASTFYIHEAVAYVQPYGSNIAPELTMSLSDNSIRTSRGSYIAEPARIGCILPIVLQGPYLSTDSTTVITVAVTNIGTPSGSIFVRITAMG